MARGMTWQTEAAVPPGKAYDYVADIMRHPEWAMDPMTVRPEGEGPARVGSRYACEAPLFGRPNPSVVTITDMERPGCFAFDAEDKRGISHHEFRFTPSGSGTRIVREMTGVKQPWFGPILAIIFRGAIDKNFNGALAHLKERLERAPVAG